MKCRTQAADFLSIGLLCGFVALIGCGHEPVSIVLEYELDSDATGDAAADLQQQVVSAVNARLNGSGEARPVGKKRLKVDLYGQLVKEQLEALERRISLRRSLQFRVLATTREFSAKTIDAALASFPQVESSNLEWLPLENPKTFGYFNQIIPNPDKTHLLVKTPAEAMKVSSEHIRQAFPSHDVNGMPVLGFRLNATGARHLYLLTSAHRPSPDGSLHYRLAIIFDGRISSAPRINEPIGASGQISGNFTQAEVEELAAIIGAGALPCAIRKIGHTTIGHETTD